MSEYDNSRTLAPAHVLPFEVSIEGPGFRQGNRYATEEEAYTEARRIRDERARNETVDFLMMSGHRGGFAVEAVRIFRWNPLIRKWVSHARRWSRNRPCTSALIPLPRDWHHDPLPADWYADPADGDG